MQNNQSSSPKVILPNGKLNTSILQAEIQNDISNHKKYYAEDEMKKRAIHMSQDYTEFQNFVKCSQLKAVDRQEMKQLFVQRDGGRGGGEYSSHRDGGSFGTLNKAFAMDQIMEKRMNKLLNDILHSTDNTNTYHHDDRKHDNSHDPKHVTTLKSDNDNDCLDVCNQYQSSYYNEFMKNQTVMNSKLKSKSHIRNVNNNTSAVCKSTKKKKGKPSSKKIGEEKSQSRNIASKGTGPKNAMEFEKEWKLYCHSSHDVLKYLTMSTNMNSISSSSQSDETKKNEISIMPIPIKPLRIVPEFIPANIFKVEMNPDIMGKIIEALAYFLKHQHQQKTQNESFNEITYLDSIQFVVRWMDAISKCGRFGLNIKFLETKQKDCLVDIFYALESYKHDHERDDRIISQESLNQMRSLYNV